MTRTCGTQIRNLALYPPELRGHTCKINRLAGAILSNHWKYVFLDISNLTEVVNPFEKPLIPLSEFVTLSQPSSRKNRGSFHALTLQTIFVEKWLGIWYQSRDRLDTKRCNTTLWTSVVSQKYLLIFTAPPPCPADCKKLSIYSQLTGWL